MSNIFNFTLLNPVCVLCSVSVDRSISLCLRCQEDLPELELCCQQCGLPFVANHSQNVCGQCLKTPPVFDYTLSLFHYESPIDYMVSQLKFKHQLSYAAIFGHLLLDYTSEKLDKNQLPDALLPVPLHHKRLQKRGFNQSLEISKPISKALQIPILSDSVLRSKNTLMQTNLSAVERKKNVKGCFKIVKPPVFKHIAIIDDVVTTGSTCNELAVMLKSAGVEKVGVWSIARANFKGK